MTHKVEGPHKVVKPDPVWWWAGEDVGERMQQFIDHAADELYMPPPSPHYEEFKRMLAETVEKLCHTTPEELAKKIGPPIVIWNEFKAFYRKSFAQIEGERVMRRYRAKRRIR